MGRHRKHPVQNSSGRSIVKEETSAFDGKSFRQDVEARLGLTKQVCYDCNATNDERADSCRKCDGDLRQKKTKFRD